MKLRALILSLLLAPCSLLVGQQPTNVQKGGAAGTNNITADLYFPAPRELRLSGIFSGTPAGGVLDLSNVDLSGDLAFSGAQSAASYSAADFFASTRLFVPKAADGSPSERMLWLSTTTADRLKYRGAATTFSLATTADIGVTVQAYDADLASIAGNATGGFLTRTAANTYTARTLTGPAAGIAVSNGDGVSGNPTLALANDLSALEGLASTGFAVRSASDTWVQRTIAGTSPVQVANGTGVSGNPTISVDAATTSASGIVELATTAETLAGTDTARANTPAGSEARALLGTLTRPVRDALYSDGATSSRRAEWTLGTAGAVAALPISIPFEFQVPTSNPSATARVWDITSNNTTPSVPGNRMTCVMLTTGALVVNATGTTSGTDVRDFTWSAFRSTYSGQYVRGFVVFSAPDTTTSPTVYVNGVDVTANFTLTTGGTPPNWVSGSLTTTYFVSSYGWTAGRFIPHAPILGALTAAEVLEWTQTGRLPTWCEIGTGSAAASFTSDFSAGVDSFTEANSNTVAGNVDGIGGQDNNLSVTRSASGSLNLRNNNAAAAVVTGRRYKIKVSVYKPAATGVTALSVWTSQASDIVVNQGALTSDTWVECDFDFTRIGSGTSPADIVIAGGTFSAAQLLYFRNYRLYPLGPIIKPVIQPGVTLRDGGSNNLTGVLTSGITPITMGDRGAFTGTLTWSGTHEGKSLIGAQAIPSNAIITRIWRKATVASSGSGCTIGTTNSATRWQALDTYTTAAEIVTLANQLPAGTAANDLDIVVDPDTANYTGSITVTVEYQIVGGTP